MDQMQSVVPTILIERDGKLLWVFKHSSPFVVCQNTWELPGGRVKFGQTIEEAVVAKAKQLLGIDVTVTEILGMVHSLVSDRTDGDGQIQFFVIPVRCTTETTKLKLDESKLREARWFSLEEIEALNTRGEPIHAFDLTVARKILI